MRQGMNVPVFVGVDGGGTKTEVFLLDPAKRTGVTCTGRASNPHTVGWNQSRDTIIDLILQVLMSGGYTPSQITGLSVGMAGVDRMDQVKVMKQELSVHFPGCKIEVVNDALPALTAGTRGKPGVVLIAGTGSIAVGEDGTGNTARSGGFGSLIGDEGSGFDIGRQGLMAALQCAERRGPNTGLWRAAQDFFGIISPSEIIAKVYESNHPVGTVASFAQPVLALSSSDSVAESIVAQAVTHYAALVESVFAQLSQAPKEVVLAGGLFRHATHLRASLAGLLPHRHVTTLNTTAAAGAVLRAMRQAMPGGDETASAIWEDVVNKTDEPLMR